MTLLKTKLLSLAIWAWMSIKEKWVLFGFGAGATNIASWFADYWMGVTITAVVGGLSIAAGIQKLEERKSRKLQAASDAKKSATEAETAEVEAKRVKIEAQRAEVELRLAQAQLNHYEQNNKIEA